MRYGIEDIEGIGATYGEKLRAAGINSTAALLQACGDKGGRKALAAKAGIDEDRLLKWANHADLMRIKGVGKQYAELLEAAGVDTVKELKHRNPANLATALAEANAKRKLTRQVPSRKLLDAWVAQAKDLPAALSY